MSTVSNLNRPAESLSQQPSQQTAELSLKEIKIAQRNASKANKRNAEPKRANVEVRDRREAPSLARAAAAAAPRDSRNAITAPATSAKFSVADRLARQAEVRGSKIPDVLANSLSKLSDDDTF